MRKVTDIGFWMDGFLQDNLNWAKEAIKKSWDCWFMFTGVEGSGKTTMCASVGYYLMYDEKTNKSNFGLDNIVWTVEQFKRALTSLPPGSAIIWDEAVFGLLSTEAMGEVQRTLMKYATTIRKRRLYVFLVIPHVFMLGRYFVNRCRAMVYVRSEDGINRGKFRFYNRDQTMYLYAEGKKHWNYPLKCHWSFCGDHKVKSLSELGIDEEEYEKRKDSAINSLYKPKKDKEVYQNLFYQVLGYVRDKEDLIWKDVPKTVGIKMSHQALQRGYSRYKEKADEEVVYNEAVENSKYKQNKDLLPDLG